MIPTCFANREFNMNNKLNNGFSIPFIPIFIVMIGTLIYFFGWIVLIYTAGLMIVITLATAVYDTITHNNNCEECMVIKETISKERGIEIALINTKHEKYFDTHMHIRIFLGAGSSMLLDIQYKDDGFSIIDEESQ